MHNFPVSKNDIWTHNQFLFTKAQTTNHQSAIWNFYYLNVYFQTIKHYNQTISIITVIDLNFFNYCISNFVLFLQFSLIH